jgi:hypothetical protein
MYMSVSSVQFSHSVVSDSLRPHGLQFLMPGFPVHHQLPESTQPQVHQVGDAVQQSHPLLSPSSPTFNLFQHQELFQWVSSSHQVAKVLEFQLQHQSLWIFRLISFRIDWFALLAVQGLSRVYAALSWRNRRRLMNVVYKMQIYSLHVEKDKV